MTLIPIPVAMAILLWLSWPKVRDWFEYQASVARHRRAMRNYVPMPHRTAPIEDWRVYLSQATCMPLLQSTVYACCDSKHIPKPEYVELVQLINARLRELGFELIKAPKGRFELQAL